MPRQALVYPDLSYKVVGLIFQVYNDLGFGYQEKYYQRALASALGESKLSFRRENPYEIDYKGKLIGKYFVDFVIEEKIALEIKVSKGIYRRHLTQLLGYLKHANLRLGILAAFTPDGVVLKRIAH